MIERIRTITVVTATLCGLGLMTLGVTSVYFEGTGAWTRLVKSGWCASCQTDSWQR